MNHITRCKGFYWVRFQRQNAIIAQKTFLDSAFGKRGALKMAKMWRDVMAVAIGPDVRESHFKGKPRKECRSNTGVVGVQLGKRPLSNGGFYRYYNVTHLQELGCGRGEKRFGYGGKTGRLKAEAFKLACRYRAQMVKRHYPK